MILNIIALVILFVLAAFFSGAETALIALAPARIKQLQKQYPKKAAALGLWLDNPNKLLTTLLIGINVVAISASALATTIALHLARDYQWPEGLAVSATAFVITGIIIIFGEVSPKIVAIHSAQKVTLFLIQPMYYFDKVMEPFSRVIVGLAGLVVTPFGISSKKALTPVTLDDIRTMATVGQDQGLFGSLAVKIIHSAMEFGRKPVASCMTLREKMDCIDVSLPVEKFVDQIVETGHTRVPVYEGTVDNIIGIVHIKDLLLAWREKSLVLVWDLLRPPLVVPPSMKVGDLLRIFQSGHQHMAIVREQGVVPAAAAPPVAVPQLPSSPPQSQTSCPLTGRVIGLVTLEDLEEEIIGDVLDEYDLEDKIEAEEIQAAKQSVIYQAGLTGTAAPAALHRPSSAADGTAAPAALHRPSSAADGTAAANPDKTPASKPQS